MKLRWTKGRSLSPQPFVCPSLEFPLLFSGFLAAQASADQGQLSTQAPDHHLPPDKAREGGQGRDKQ
ncbi:hypothetical protein I79_003464 [Cricetulus griseus]|uniref:Uncharacterized protein n=1 Tax=Cricetulus griseus TaxID=10029 RepID=G3H016_CRIGR|nr:hypothetical protein I79_003464 [Cricetulus griseus]